MRRNVTLLLLSALVFATGCNMPRSLPIVKESGERAYSRGQYDQAAADFSEYLDRKPGEPSVQMLYAKTLIKLDEPTKAAEYAALAYDQRPSDEEYIRTRAESLFAAGRTDELYRFLRGQTEVRGAPADYIRLGEFAQRLGDADGAEHAFLTAARIDGGTSVEPQLALADFYHSIGDKPNELKRLRMALYLDPKNQEIPRRIRDLGEIPGPSIAMPPTEAP